MALTVESLRPIHPRYDYKHTDDDPRRACSTYLSETNNPPPPDAPKEDKPHCSVQQLTVDWKGKARGLFLRYNHTEEEAMCTKTADDCKARDPVICRGRTRTRCTQTRYRESSAQTHPYLPEIAGNKRKYEKFEIYQIANLLDTCTAPGAYEAKVVERTRRRLQFEHALRDVAHDKVKSQTILEAMEWQNWIAREEDIQSIQMLRMEIVQKLFTERESKFSEISQKRIELGVNRIQAKQRAQLKKIDVEYLRAMRQLEARRQNVVTSYRKGNIAENHVNPASDLHAPQMRFGVNPNRRHFVSFRKNFDDRIDELDKRREERGLSTLECPFRKLRTWAKPKERMKEVSQRFCSEENLKNLYESLKSLRTTAEAQKSTPKCLKKKETKEVVAEEVPQRKYSQKTMTERVKRGVLSDCVEFTGIEDEPEQGECLTEQELLNTLRQRRSEEVAHKIRSDLLGMLAQYEGSTQGKLLKFLRDELERLNQMKKFQAIQMIAEKERWKREATEAGRRQKENKIREDNEALYTATSDVRKDLSTIFLKSVLEEEFAFPTEALTTENIAELAKSIDKDEMELEGRDKRSLYRAIISDSLNNQVFKVVEKKLEKMRADQQLDADIKALTEQLYRSVADALNQRYYSPDSVVLVGEFLDELIDDAVTYDFDVFTPDTSDDEFDPKQEVGAIIDKLLKAVIHPPGGRKEDFIDATDWQAHLNAKREASAIIRKMVRRTIPAERWKHQSDRIVEQTLSDTFNAAVYEVECLKTSRIVCADDKLRAAIFEIYHRMNPDAEDSDAAPLLESASSQQLKSIPSTFELFDHPRYKSVVHAESGQEIDEFSTRKINYVDPSEWVQVEPAELSHHHERYNILGKVAKRYRRQEPRGKGGDCDSSSSPFSMRSTTTSMGTPDELIGSHSSSYLGLDALHPDFVRPGSAAREQRPLMSASSYEKACIGYERLSYEYDEEKND